MKLKLESGMFSVPEYRVIPCLIFPLPAPFPFSLHHSPQKDILLLGYGDKKEVTEKPITKEVFLVCKQMLSAAHFHPLRIPQSFYFFYLNNRNTRATHLKVEGKSKVIS